MNALRWTLALGATFGLLGFSGAAPLEPQQLRAEWTFAEGAGTTAGDSSGNGFTATLVNGASWTVGKIGSAVKLDGVNDYVALPANMSVAQNASAVSVAAWVNLSSLPANGAFRELVSLSINAASPTDTSRIALSLVGDGTAADVFAGARSTDAEAQKSVTATTANLAVGTWYHLAAVFDFAGNTIKVYRNGILLVTQAVTFTAAATANTPSTNGALGAQDTGTSNFFHGALDEVKIYSRALTTSEVERMATGDGLRAQWKLDEGAGTFAGDSSGNLFDGTLQGGPTWATGQMGGALSFDGVDDRVSLGSNLSVVRNVNAATLSAWIKPGTTIPAGSFRELISISVNSGSPTNTSRVALALQGNGSAGNLFGGGRSTETETQKTLTDTSNLAVGQWVHVAAVIDFSGKTITLYKNGIQTATAAAPFLQTHTPNTVSTSGALGSQDADATNAYNGLMDDVRIYGRALSANEIEDLVMHDCLMGYWKFDEGTGTTAADSSGNGVTATLTNGATWGGGQFGGAVSFDGVNDFVALPANTTMLNQANAATLSAWVKLSSLPASGSFRELISISAGSANPTNTSRAALSLVGDGTAADVFAGARSTDTETQQNLTAAGANIPIGVFTHVAAVFDFAGNSIKIYVNGALSASALVNFSQAATPNTPSRNGALGSQDMGDSNYVAGLLDEVRVYCRALTSNEIQALATVSTPPIPVGLVAVSGDTQVTLSWSSSAGATSYNIYRRLQTDSTFGAAIANTAQTTYTDSGLTNGLTYVYAVSALNLAGESAKSGTVPGAPTGGQAPAKPVLITQTQTTNDNTPDVVGTSDPNVTITVFFKQGATTVETLTTTANFQGNWSVTAGAKADGAYTVTARASNGSGNSPDSDPITLTIDTGAPTVTSVTSTTANGAFTTGAAINVTVNFSEPVTLAGGNLLVALNTGAVVSIPPFGPASSAVGTYAVAAGQSTADLTATSPLTLAAGAKMTDAGGNAAVLAIPAGQNLGNLKDIAIDTTVPAITSVTSTTSNGTYGVGSSVNITVNFSEPVTLAGGSLQVTLNTGAVISLAPFASASLASGTYTVAAGQNSTDLSAVSPLSLQAGATLQDAAGNATPLTIPAGQNLGDLKNIVIDTSAAPAVTSVSSTTANGTYSAGAGINITIAFNKPVTLAGGNLNVTLSTGAVVGITPFGPAASATGTYTVAAGQNSPDLNAVSPLALAAGATLRDSAANNSALTIPPGQNLANLKDIVIDTSAPTIANITSTNANGTYAVGAAINITVNFSEPVTLAGGTLNVTLSTGAVVAIAPFGPATSASGTYTVAAGQNSPDLTATSPLALQAGATLRDLAGNNATLTIPAGQNLGDLKNIVIDTTVPTVTSVTSTTANGIFGVGAALNITVNFSKPVTLAGGNLNVSLSTGAVVAIAPFGPAASASGTYTVAAGQNSADLTATSPLTLAAGATLKDAAGTAATLSIPAGQNLGDLKDLVIDTTAPAVTSVTSTSANGAYGAGASINITVNFSEPVTLLGNTLQVTLSTGAVVALSPFGPAASATGTYVVAAGQNSSDLNAASPLTLSGGATLRDAAGNNATLIIPANQNLADLKNIVVDTTAPGVASVSSTTANGTYGIGAAINITVTFSEPIQLTNGNLLVSLNTGAIVQISPFGPATSASGVYTVGAGQSSSDLTAISPLSLQSGATLQDPTGNAASLAIPAGQNLGDLKNIVILTLAAPPTGLVATAGNNQVVLSWVASPLAASYNVFRGTTHNGPYPTVVATGFTGTSLTDTGVTNDTAYFYIVTALNGAGESGASNEATATPNNHPIPPAPTNVRTTSYNNTVDVEWDAIPSVAGYRVYRKTGTNGTWGLLNTTGVVLNTKYRDSTAANGTVYFYRVTAVGN